MQNLDKRVAALESKSGQAENLTFIRHYVSAGHLDEEIYRLRDDYGNTWTRQPNETEQELKDRATKEVKRNPLGFAILTASDGAVPHATH